MANHAPFTPGQVRALDREPDHDPSLTPDDGSPAVRMGSRLADMADAINAVPDGSDAATTQTLVNAIKAQLALAFSRE